MNVEPYDRSHREIVIRLDAGAANLVLLALERLDQRGGLDPELAKLRDAVRSGLVTRVPATPTAHPARSSAV